MLLGDVELGFHSNWTEITDFEARVAQVEAYEKDLDYENTVAYYNRIEAVDEIMEFISSDISLYFALKVVKFHPKKMWYPTVWELEDSGVVNW